MVAYVSVSGFDISWTSLAYTLSANVIRNSTDRRRLSALCLAHADCCDLDETRGWWSIAGAGAPLRGEHRPSPQTAAAHTGASAYSPAIASVWCGRSRPGRHSHSSLTKIPIATVRRSEWRTIQYSVPWNGKYDTDCLTYKAL